MTKLNRFSFSVIYHLPVDHPDGVQFEMYEEICSLSFPDHINSVDQAQKYLRQEAKDFGGEVWFDNFTACESDE